MKLENDFRADLTVVELLQYLDDKRERVLLKIDRNEEYFMERLEAHDLSEDELKTLDELDERYGRMLRRYNDLINGISRISAQLTATEE